MLKLMSVHDAALILNMAVITLRRLIKKRGIPFHRIGRRYYFTEDDIQSFLSQTAVPIGGVKQ
jgi:excisionase family DNA binding protein